MSMGSGLQGGLEMAVKKMMDKNVSQELLVLLKKAGIGGKRITLDINLSDGMVEIKENSQNIISDLLEIPNILSAEAAKKMGESVRRSRDEWDR